MSEFWKRKMRTRFHRLDFDKDGVISRKDHELLAERFCAAQKVDPVKEEKLRKLHTDVWLKITSSTKTNEKVLLTEAVMIDSLLKQRNDPNLKAIFKDAFLSFFTAMNTNEDGYVQLAEFRGTFDKSDMPDTSFAEELFKAINTNRDGKLSIDELTDAFMEFTFSENEDSPCNMFFGPLM